ncbi:MAG: Stk1 family PASTA domain-containing Ser/Thr kinase [Roseburia sp.]|nr:Stk1 family PASTA domain-containing Ser/Thr kinase [Roseburia sp.]
MVSVGTIISDRYEILEKVGSGGMADVFRAKCHRLNRFVAIKILKQEYSEDTKFVTKFRGEAQAVACMSHPNIVGIYDVGEENGMYYIVMELIDGITLKKYIEEKGKLTVKEAVGISLQIANGLDAAHRNNIIHRDIKPQNILIARDGTAKVTDFGIAKAASSNTITANAMGSVHYISPEQARGGYSDEKSDVYSLGVTMYEMLSGTLPFTGESAVAIALAHIQEDATPLAAMDGTIPKGLSNIVNKCMQKKTELRYASAADLIADLKMFLQDPSGDYGVIGNLYENGGTIFMSKDDVNTLKNASRSAKPPIGDHMKKEEDAEDMDDEDNKSDVDPKLEKALVFGSIAVAIIIGLVVIYMLGRFIGLWGSASSDNSGDNNTTASATAAPGAAGDGEYVLPDFSDQLKDSVIVELGNEDIKCKIVEEASDDVEEGKVIRTNPEAGTAVKKGSEIELVISSGAEQFSVPSTSGDTLDEARKKLTEQGMFEVEDGQPEEVYSNSVEKGLVAYTEPAAGKKVARGTKIKIFLSKGKETKMVTVPNLLGMTRSEAKKALQEVGLKYGNETKNYSAIQKNRVCVQSVARGKQVEEGTSIDVTLSLGEEQTYTYKGSVTISNPFEYETDPAAMFKFVLTQSGGSPVTVREVSLGYHDFPYALDVEGSSTDQGELTVYRDGVKVATYNVTFKRVAD